MEEKKNVLESKLFDSSKKSNMKLFNNNNNVDDDGNHADLKLWRHAFRDLSNPSILDSVTGLVRLAWYPRCGYLTDMGYFLITEDGGIFIYGETVCNWLGMKHNPRMLKEITMLRDKKINQVEYGIDFIAVLTDDGNCFLGNVANSEKEPGKMIRIPGIYRKICTSMNMIFMIKINGDLFETSGHQYCGDSLIRWTKIGRVRDVAASHQDALAVTYENELYLFQYSKGLLTPKLLSWLHLSTEPIISIACGHEHFLVLFNDGKLYGFGCSEWNELAQLNSFNIINDNPILVKINEDNPILVKINDNCLFKRIFSNWTIWFTIAVSQKNESWVWGWVNFEVSVKGPLNVGHFDSFSHAIATFQSPPLTCGLTFKR